MYTSEALPAWPHTTRGSGTPAAVPASLSLSVIGFTVVVPPPAWVHVIVPGVAVVPVTCHSPLSALAVQIPASPPEPPRTASVPSV